MSYTGGGKFSEIFARSRAPSFLEMVQAAGLTKQQRDARAAAEEQAALEREQMDFNRQRLVAADERANNESLAAARGEAEKRKANKERYFAQLLQSRPGDADRISQAARAQGIELGTMTTPDTMRQARAANVEIDDATTPSQAAEMLQGRASGVLGAPDPTRAPAQKRSPFAQQLIDANIQEGSPRFNELMDEYNAAELAKMKREPKGMTTTINMPGALEGSTKSEATKSLMEGETLLADIADLKSIATPEGSDRPDYGQFLGLKNRARNYTLNAIAGIAPGNLDQETLDQLGKAREFSEGVDQIYLRAKKDITGVSAGEKELREIRGAVLNTDMSSPEFSASIDRLERVTNRNMEIKRRLLAKGIDLRSKNGKQQFSSEIERAMKSEAPATPQRHPKIKDIGAADARAVQLESEGRQPEEVIEILRSEGLVQ